MKILASLISAIIIPFLFLNLFGGIVAGIWLALLSEWSSIFLGLLFVFFGAFAAALFLAPGLGLAALGAAAFDRGNTVIGWGLLLLASPWTYIVIIAWELAVFSLFGQRMTSANVVPMWLWSYGAATGVWSFMASKEQQTGDGGSAAMAAFAAQLAYVVFSLCFLLLDWSLQESVIAMIIPVALILIVGITEAFAMHRATMKRRSIADEWWSVEN